MTYTLSGVTSAIYHSCDAGGWCALSYDTLQVCLIDDYPTLFAYCTLPPMFGTSLWNVYFILENDVRQFQIEFSKILMVEEQVCKVHLLLCILLIVIQWVGTINIF